MKNTNTLGEQLNFKFYHQPGNVTELTRLLEEIRAKDENFHVTSTGNNWGYGCAAPHSNSQHHISLKNLNKIKSFDQENGIITLEPGVTYEILYNFLEKNAPQWIAPVHGGGPDCSVVGNALERGYGITPIMDHFSACQSLEAILPNGEIYKSPLKSIGLDKLANSFRYGIGPYLDGMFTQSNFGIVTEMTIKLAPKPEEIELFFINLCEKELDHAVEAIKLLKSKYKGIVGGINLMNKERVLSMLVDYPTDDIENLNPLSEEFIADNKKKFLIEDWNIIGAIYGPKEIVKATKKLIKKDLRKLRARKLFISQSKINVVKYLIEKLPILFPKSIKKSVESLSELLEILNGIPKKTALKLAYWKNLSNKNYNNPTHDNCGLIWYAPLVELSKDNVREYINFIRDVSKRFDINPLITLTTVDELCLDSTIPILFNKEDMRDQKRAHEYFDTLLEEGFKKGFFPYRFGTNSMKSFTDKLDPDYAEILNKIKDSFDHQRLYAEGRYMRELESKKKNKIAII